MVVLNMKIQTILNALLVVCLTIAPIGALADQTEECGSTSSANGVLVYDLKSAIKRGLDASPDIKAYESELEASYSESKEVRAALLPQVFLSASKSHIGNSGQSERDADYLTQDSTTTRVGVEQKLFDAPAYFRFKAAGLRSEYSQISLDKRRMDIVLSIQENFFLYFKAKEDASSYAKSIERLEKHLESAKAFYARQLAPKISVLQAQSELAKAKQLFSAAQNDILIQKTRLAHLLDLPNHEDVDFEGNLRDFMEPMLYSLPELLNRGISNRPDIHLAQKEVAIYNQDANAAGAEMLPVVSVSAQKIMNDIDYENSQLSDVSREYYSTGLNMNINLFEGGRTYYKVQKTKHRKQRALLQLQSTQQAAQSSIRENYLNLQEARRQIDLSNVYIEEADETYQRAQKGYELGVNTSTDLVDAASELVNAEVMLNRSLADYHISRARLIHSIGDMTQLVDLASVH